ncbi:MAG: ribonuclease P Rpr2/Rpp21/SNM1 subunit [Euryarchaeota archaeon]
MAKRRPRRVDRIRLAQEGLESMARLWLTSDSPEISSNAGKTLIRLSRRHRIKVPTEIRMRVCRSCKKILDSNNSKTRIRLKGIVVSCMDCGRTHRYHGGV